MINGYKWCPAVCPSCGASVQPFITEVDEPEPLVSLYPCWNCEYPEEVEAECQKWEEADRKLSEMIARGEVKDSDGNPVPDIRVTQ